MEIIYQQSDEDSVAEVMGKCGDETSVAEINIFNIYKLHTHHPGLCSGGVDYGFTNAGSSVLPCAFLYKDLL